MSIRIIGYIYDPWFNTKDILKFLDYDNDIQNILLYLDDMYKSKYKNIFPKHNININDDNDDNNVDNNDIYINKDGLKYILFKIKKINIDKFYKFKELTCIKSLNLNLDNNISFEKNYFIDEIINFFSNHIIFKEFKINEYFVDLYFPKFNLVIICNDYNYQENSESIEKEYIIKSILNCKFIYFNPFIKDFYFTDILKEIYDFLQLKKYIKLNISN